jgi:hypothetical protein
MTERGEFHSACSCDERGMLEVGTEGEMRHHLLLLKPLTLKPQRPAILHDRLFGVVQSP